ncbi:MAG: pyrroloquinoline quinone-dependent dehydrogenase [Bryobacteraceae bacterium]|nr:pyrroloquinoline quinone-dependent dehydrogenase [Bryobacteraceae bacterium]
MRIWLALPLALPAIAQQWMHHGGDAGAMKYSALKQIDRSNVEKLKIAWTYQTGDVSDGRGDSPIRSAFETTPLMVGGTLYFTTPFARLIALDAATGKEKWTFDPKLDRARPQGLWINRGAAYWSDGRQARLFYGTLDGRLFAVDAKSGKAIDNFGTGGSVDLGKGYGDQWPGKTIGLTSPPAIYKNVVICGSIVPDGDPQGPSGDVRGLDAITGKELWRFHTVPREGEHGYDTWAAGSAKDRGGANVWSMLSVDSERGLVFLPLTSPAHDYYGGDRHGANLFGDSVVALDALTGKRKWHFQTVHHNIWDYDLPSAPVLVSARHQGRTIPAVAQITKTGFVFLLDRESGKPLFPVEERAVPPSEVPGEKAWPTQPYPVKPPPFARQSMKVEELANIEPAHTKACAEIVKDAVIAPLYTPIGLKTTILFPGTNGGANWGGGSFDPETRTLYVNSMDVGMTFRLTKRPEGSAIPYRTQGARTPNSRFWDSRQWPCQQPPWGHLTAIDLDKGEFKWRVTLGVIDELLAKGLPPTGTSNLGGSVVTAGGLLFIGATNDSRFRAFDKETGKELWVTKLPASAHANPMTYSVNGKQYVAIAAGGGNKYNSTFSDTLVVFALPENSAP